MGRAGAVSVVDDAVADAADDAVTVLLLCSSDDVDVLAAVVNVCIALELCCAPLLITCSKSEHKQTVLIQDAKDEENDKRKYRLQM